MWKSFVKPIHVFDLIESEQYINSDEPTTYDINPASCSPLNRLCPLLHCLIRAGEAQGMAAPLSPKPSHYSRSNLFPLFALLSRKRTMGCLNLRSLPVLLSTTLCCCVHLEAQPCVLSTHLFFKKKCCNKCWIENNTVQKQFQFWNLSVWNDSVDQGKGTSFHLLTVTSHFPPPFSVWASHIFFREECVSIICPWNPCVLLSDVLSADEIELRKPEWSHVLNTNQHAVAVRLRHLILEREIEEFVWGVYKSLKLH